MAWSSPRTWSPGELVTASLMNAHVRDNLNIIKTPIDDNGYPKTLLASAAGLVSNTGTGETDLQSFTLAADVLDADGGSFFLWTVFALAANGNTKTIKFYVGSTSVVIHSAATNSARLVVRLIVTRSSTTAGRLFAWITQSSGVSGSGAQTVTAHQHFAGDQFTSLDFTASQLVKFTGTGGATSDITQIAMPVELRKGPIV